MKSNEQLNAFKFKQMIKKTLANKFGLEGIYSGRHIIRNEKGWRENEIQVDYIWITIVRKSFFGFGGLVAIKFEGNEFRNFSNPEKLIQGVFLFDSKGNVKELYFEEQMNIINDSVKDIKNLELFSVNEGISVGGVIYDYNVISNNIESNFTIVNPNSRQWRKWENEVWNLGNKLAQSSDNNEMKQLFE